MISVIVPVYNVEKYISRTIDSILAQTMRDIEIILIDDGSTDGSSEIVDAYVARYPEKIQVIHTPNCGVTCARMAGIKSAKGEYIGFVDGDDEIEKDMYELLYKNAKKYQADISHCGYQMIFPDGRIHYFHNTRQILVQDTKKGVKDLLDGSLIEPGLWNKLFHKKLFDSILKNDLMDCSIKINEDLLMNFYLFTAAKRSIFQDICKYHYIVRENSASRQKLNKYRIFDPIKVKEIIIKKSDSALVSDAKKSYIGTCIGIYNLLILERQQENKKQVRVLLMRYKQDFNLLNCKYRIISWMIQYVPSIYEKTYKIYARFLMNHKYE